MVLLPVDSVPPFKDNAPLTVVFPARLLVPAPEVVLW